MEVETDEKTAERRRFHEDVEALREGLRAADAGEMIPAEQFFDEMAERYGIPMEPGLPPQFHDSQ